MIKVSFPKKGKTIRIKVQNSNGNIFNHNYNRSSTAKKMWASFVRQIQDGKFTVE